MVALYASIILTAFKLLRQQTANLYSLKAVNWHMRFYFPIKQGEASLVG